MDPVDPDITTLGGDFLSLLDVYELSAAYSCTVEPACPSGGIVFDQTSGVVDATNINSNCRWVGKPKNKCEHIHDRIKVFFVAFMRASYEYFDHQVTVFVQEKK